MTIVIEPRIRMMTIDIVDSEQGSSALVHLGANVLKKNSIRLAAALLTTLSGLTPALASAPQHHDQVPGYFRLKVGDLEVTALYDAAAVFQLDWLKGKKARMDGVATTLQQDRHLLDAADRVFLVIAANQL